MTKNVYEATETDGTGRNLLGTLREMNQNKRFVRLVQPTCNATKLNQDFGSFLSLYTDGGGR